MQVSSEMYTMHKLGDRYLLCRVLLSDVMQKFTHVIYTVINN